MSFDGFFDAISRIVKFSKRWDDDFCDRLNHRFSSIILMCILLVVGYKQYVGEPIVCWCPGSWTGAMVDYAHQICWISNTYYLPREKPPLLEEEPRPSVLIYYQWIPFILLVQMLLFQLPNLLWKTASKFIGIDLSRLTMTVAGVENVNPEIRDRTVRVIVKQIDRSLAVSAWRNTGLCATALKKHHGYMCWLGCGRTFGNYLVTLYMFCKVLYLANTVGQMFLLNVMLGAEDLGVHFLFYGVEILQQLAVGENLSKESKVFPRVTMCDFIVRQMGNLHRYTIECALPINLFNEKIYITLWFWLVLLTLLNITNMCFWISSFFSVSRILYIKKYLSISEKMKRSTVDSKHLPCFVEEYLRQDGAFALRMLAKNTTDVIVAEIVCKLWDNFILHHGHRGEFHKKHSSVVVDVEEELLSRPTELAIPESQSKQTELSKATKAPTATPTTPGNIFP